MFPIFTLSAPARPPSAPFSGRVRTSLPWSSPAKLPHGCPWPVAAGGGGSVKIEPQLFSYGVRECILKQMSKIQNILIICIRFFSQNSAFRDDGSHDFLGLHRHWIRWASNQNDNNFSVYFEKTQCSAALEIYTIYMRAHRSKFNVLDNFSIARGLSRTNGRN